MRNNNQNPSHTNASGGHEGSDDKPFPLESSIDYRINLSVFEGPIDLLLYLIRKNELDIHEVSLSQIANEYLEYVELIKLIDLERAGDFIVIASTLMKIKSASLFSQKKNEHGEIEDDEARSELIRYLLEYQKLGGAADKLAEHEAKRHGVFPRGGDKRRLSELFSHSEQAPDYMLFDLFTAFRDVLESAPKEDVSNVHEVDILNITSEMKQREIMSALKQKKSIEFLSLVEGRPRLIIVVTFVAMLELIKNGKILIKQTTQFGRIMLYERTDNTG